MLDVVSDPGASGMAESPERLGDDWSEEDVFRWCLRSPLHHRANELPPPPELKDPTLCRFKVRALARQ